MKTTVETRVEGRRGCGFRKEGGLYLVSGGQGMPCGQLPIPLIICPSCGSGIHVTRGWTWVNATALAATHPCTTPEYCAKTQCPLATDLGRTGLLWVGESFYPRPADFTAEAAKMGISRRINTVPHGFEVGKTWVLFAHRKTIENPDGTFTPAVFRVFLPTCIEYIVRPTDTDEFLEGIVKRGITPVKVIHKPSTEGLVVGTGVHVSSAHFKGECDGVIEEVVYDLGWLYRIQVTAGDRLESQRNEEEELWVCEFEVGPMEE